MLTKTDFPGATTCAEADMPPESATVVVIGRESVGKSQLISSLTGCAAGEANFRGSTVTVESYETSRWTFVDTPGLLRQSDTETTRDTLAALNSHDVVLLVTQATQLDDDLRETLPLVVGKRGAVAVTFWDKVHDSGAAQAAIQRLAHEVGVPFVTLDARRVHSTMRDELERHLQAPREFQRAQLTTRAGWRVEPKPGWLERKVVGPLIAVLLLILPALAAVYGANALADWLNPVVSRVTDRVVSLVEAHLPAWLHVILIAKHGDFGYGLLNMGPFLILWALPTVLLFAVILGAYKASGLVDRMNVALHPLVRPLGLSGRDVVRIVMGFGCNVPAVISTRACSRCSRGQAIAAIAFSAACSYQLPATLAVLAAAGQATAIGGAGLTWIYLSYLAATSIVYLWCTAPANARNSLNVLLTPARPFMQWPSIGALWREARGTLRQFFAQALPVFAAICVVASLLSYSGALDAASRGLAPIMSLFDLPAEAAVPVLLASIRKDGIFLFVSEGGLRFSLTASQTLTAVYLAGTLLPCLVTSWTIARETSWRLAAQLLARQALFAIGFSLVLAWGGRWLL